MQAGGSPTYTLTEDFALGMEMVKRQWKCRYVSSYLVVGEAPEQVRNAMQQRSRWVKVRRPKNVPFPHESDACTLSICQRALECPAEGLTVLTV